MPEYEPDPENIAPGALDRRIETLPPDPEQAADHMLIAPPSKRETPDHLRCSYRLASGRRCKAQHMRGTTLCYSHGGGAKAIQARVQRNVDEELKELAFKATDALDQALDADVLVLDRTNAIRNIGPNHALRERAAEAVLDRSGHGKQTEVDVHASVHLAALIKELDADE